LVTRIVGDIQSHVNKTPTPFGCPYFLGISSTRQPRTAAADAGFARVGYRAYIGKREADRNHHGLRSKPDFDRRWAVLGSNQ
jgi:hypothetical protein